MNLKKAIASLVLLNFGFFTFLYGSEVKITNAVYHDIDFDSAQPKVKATLTLSWENAWNNERNRDAIWLFFKISNQNNHSQKHAPILNDGLKYVYNYLKKGPSPEFNVASDNMGIFISTSDKHNGPVSWRIQVLLDLTSIQGISLDETLYINPQAIEMVFIPQGPFYVGDSGTDAQENTAAFFEYGTKKHYHIRKEQAIQVGKLEGQLYYNNKGDTIYKGDALGPIPDLFPKGYAAFYIMKYELTEGEYVEFLNSIGSYYARNRVNFGAIDYKGQRGGIYHDNQSYKTDNPGRPCNFISFQDAAAYTDWAALRPVTELEYEKACRGPEMPVENDFPWGTNTEERLSRYYNAEGNLVFQEPIKEEDLTDANKDIYGASYYWVMDLNKSLWERCVTIGNPKGRNFKGSHGDGILGGYYGNATNTDWPDGLSGSSGLSYRGGGSYYFGMVGSPRGQVGHRPFGAWGDGPRAIAYGYRAGRSAI